MLCEGGHFPLECRERQLLVLDSPSQPQPHIVHLLGSLPPASLFLFLLIFKRRPDTAARKETLGRKTLPTPAPRWHVQTPRTNCRTGRNSGETSRARGARRVPREGLRMPFLPGYQAAPSQPDHHRERGGPREDAPSLSRIPAASALQRTPKGQGAHVLSAGYTLLPSYPAADGAEIQRGLEYCGPFFLPVPQSRSLISATFPGALRISAPLR